MDITETNQPNEFNDFEPPDLNFCLHYYAFAANKSDEALEKFKNLLSQERNMDELDQRYGRTALHWAIIANNLEVATLLLQKGANVNTPDKANNSPIHYAINNNSIVDLLNCHQADLNREGNLGYPVNIAVKSGNFQILEKLIENGATLQSDTLDHAIETKDRIMIRYIISQTANYTLENVPFLHYVAEFGDLSKLEHLINFETEVNEEDNNGLTPLYYACHYNYENACILIEHGANINHRTSGGLTPLHESIRYHTSKIYQLLIERGADVNARCSGDGWSALILSMARCEPLAFKMMLERGVDAEVAERGGETPLMFATNTTDDFNYLELLLPKIVNINQRDSSHQTALHHAVLNSNLQAVNLLIQYNADLDCRSNLNQTALSYAVRLNNLEIIKELIVNGADVNVDPYLLAVCPRDADMIVDLLVLAGLNLRWQVVQEEVTKRYCRVFCWKITRLTLAQLSRLALKNTFKKHYVKFIETVNLPETVKQFLRYEV